MTFTKPVLISGGGIASLLLASTLQRSNIPFIVFERDASPIFRAQGYRLRLSNEGLNAIEKALSPEKWQKFWDTCGKTGGVGLVNIDPITGKPLDSVSDNNPGDNKPATKPPPEMLASRDGKVVGISRGDMRKVFLEGIEDSVRWGHHVRSYELTPDGVRAVFADGSKSEEGCMLVGGEGIYSYVAKQLSGDKLKVYDLGSRGIHGQAPSTAFKGLGEGVFLLIDEKTVPSGKIFLITNVRSGDKDDPNVIFGWTMVGSPGVIQPPNNNYTLVGKPAADIAKSLTKNWHPRFKPLFDNMVESETAFWKITCSSPDGVPEWPNNPRVTVIGDAVHSMTPAGGIGANTAVRDSELLGRLLAEAGEFKEGITEAYEKEMRIYASEAVKTSFGQAHVMFGTSSELNTVIEPRDV
ncbi:FAD/NAD(P)-binding domain-containing protein [Bimuria novae-zelandiae CBS 107.79]|uniref:FAD/NAD(P)-binding domain-containing protein n=1 Tax=Bimuria novae-zelandiae CBS 107.79 TaxID=1447943 RepID=A0A6A5UW34_9PLEO|nr:FAD/NAD(P)-binding domain-containing protein [Bimuria novae-zelandiae CBS 107.79]